MPSKDKKVSKTPKVKKLSNPFSTGGGGVNFENRVQASFAVLMLAGGVSPCTRAWPIKAIHLQAKHLGVETDDVVVEAHEPNAGRKSRLLAQIKHDVAFTVGNSTFAEVITAAWKDFSKNLSHGYDALALITGPLSGADLELRTLLEWARTSPTSDDFFKKVGRSNFSSANKQSKLKAVMHHLKAANGGVSVDEDTAWKFLKAFHVLQYDLDIAGGVNRAFLTCIISQFGISGSEGTWAQLIEAVRDINQSAGTIDVETLPMELVEAFQTRAAVTISRELLPRQTSPSATKDTDADNPLIAIVQLVGSWNEASPADQEYVSELAGEPYAQLTRKLSIELNNPGTVLRHKRGIWSVNDREKCWEIGGPHIFDRHLEIVQKHATQALSQDDVSLSAEDMLADKEETEDAYSQPLRSAFANTLALMATRPEALPRCRKDMVQNIPQVVVAQTMRSGGWLRVASIDRDLAILAEAAPEAFLDSVAGWIKRGDTFQNLFSQERGGTFARTFSTGLLWGLENLAWSSEFLGRVTLILGDLDALDPGGQWTNRPLESLTSIFLPWHPQTTASLPIRTSALHALGRKHPATAWAVYVAALPGVTQTTSGTHRPKWQDFGAVEVPQVTRREYFQEITNYTESLLGLAASQPEYLADLAEHLPNLPPEAFSQAVRLIGDNIGLLEESGRNHKIWTVLKNTARKHTAFASADWAIPSSSVNEIESLASRLQPADPSVRYQERFGTSDPLTYDREMTWQERHQKNEALQEQAVREIWEIGGLAAVVSFAGAVDRPRLVGVALAKIEGAIVPLEELQRWATSDSQNLGDLLMGYVAQNFATRNGKWLGSLGLDHWSTDTAAKLLTALPFSRATWDVVERLLGRAEGLYWASVGIGLIENKRDLRYTVKKLLKQNRPDAAVEALHSYMFRFGDLDAKDATKALLALAKAAKKLAGMDSYDVEALIKRLQTASDANLRSLEKIEWAYLDLLVQLGRETFPKTIEQRLADDPDFYLDVLAKIYRPKGAPSKEPTEQERQTASAAYRLLLHWRTPPGQKIGDGFSSLNFKRWFEIFVEKSETKGYLDIGLSRLGYVLIHVPEDPSGFWVNRAVAEALDESAYDSLRSGYRTGLYNARGAHWVDPTGAPENALAHKYKVQAETAELEGFFLLAACVRALSKDYEQQAGSVAERFGLDDDD
ncbi:hypothetical protein HFO45_26385 [Rhizobium leguminosarum]|uniref:hypothetical protein n=1 Tax=Rhizobium leguminosarum TaxID=384 RepID=UPI001C966260|nr:hypothetical protein [Rhizobium leguminosarum]MBY5651750.1 hypothetical protein [Rhizobium leguminosarum]